MTCDYECASYDGIPGVTEADYLILLAHYGRALGADDPMLCLDSRTSGDRYVDLSDLAGWDTFFEGSLNACGGMEPRPMTEPPPAPPGSAPQTVPTGRLLVAGKEQDQTDRVWAIDPAAGDVIEALAPGAGESSRGNGVLIAGPAGQVCQVHGVRGLVDLRSGQAVVPPGQRTLGGDVVYIGLQDYGGGDYAGAPLADAAIRGQSVYILPVISGAGRVAAKLVMSSPGQYELVGFYGSGGDKPREIEIGRDGGTVFIMSADAAGGTDWLLIYDEATGAETRVPLPMRSPRALLASAKADTLYISSSIEAMPRIYRFRYLAETSEILEAGSIGIAGCSQVTTIAERPGDARLYAVGFQAPTLPEDQTFTNDAPIFMAGRIAVIPADADWSGSAIIASDELPIPLPVSALFSGGAGPDLDGDGDVDLSDFGAFQSCYNGPNRPRPSGCADADADGDGDVDLSDFGAFQGCFNGPNRPEAC